METEKLQRLRDILAAGKRANHPMGAHERSAFTILWKEDPMGREAAVELLGPWLEQAGIDDTLVLTELWSTVLGEEARADQQAACAKRMLDSLDSFLCRGVLLGQLVLGQPGGGRGGHMLRSWPLVREWLEVRKDHTSQEQVLHRLLEHGVALACRHEQGTHVLRMLLEDPSFATGAKMRPDSLRLVSEWVRYAAWDPGARFCRQALDVLVEHGQDLELEAPHPTSRVLISPLALACEAFEEMGGAPESRDAIGLLLTAGAEWKTLEGEVGPRAWACIQQHPRVRSAHLLALAETSSSQTRVKPKL